MAMLARLSAVVKNSNIDYFDWQVQEFDHTGDNDLPYAEHRVALASRS